MSRGGRKIQILPIPACQARKCMIYCICPDTGAQSGGKCTKLTGIVYTGCRYRTRKKTCRESAKKRTYAIRARGGSILWNRHTSGTSIRTSRGSSAWNAIHRTNTANMSSIPTRIGSLSRCPAKRHLPPMGKRLCSAGEAYCLCRRASRIARAFTPYSVCARSALTSSPIARTTHGSRTF